jgi:hypothetical protein
MVELLVGLPEVSVLGVDSTAAHVELHVEKIAECRRCLNSPAVRSRNSPPDSGIGSTR